MAPDADLLLATYDRTSGFVDAVEWLVRSGVTIISYSDGLDGGSPRDDTSRRAAAVDRAKSLGIFFVIAAGNSGSGKIGSSSGAGHYSAMFTDTDGDGNHDFDGSNGMAVKIGKSMPVIILDWANWTAPHGTYALILSDAQGQEVARAAEPVTPAHPTPAQLLEPAVSPGTYTLRVRKMDGDMPASRFDIFFDGAQFGQTTPAESITVPADARGAVAVGETDWVDDTVFSSSSRGPTADGRAKPELVAPACVTNATVADALDEDFCGTSAAAPHVAGAAALYKQAYPDATPDDILAYFQQNAKKLDGADGDPNASGAGRLQLGPPPARPA